MSDTDRLAELLIEVFPAANRNQWPFAATDVAAALIAAGVCVAPSPDAPGLPTVDAMRAALHEQGIGCKPNVPYCRASHRGHAERLVASLAALAALSASPEDGLDVLRQAEDWLRDHGYNATANDVRIVIDREDGDD